MITAKRSSPIADYLGRMWFKIFEDGRFKTLIQARSASQAIRIYNQNKHLAR
jgi:hypothetical protein